MRKIKGNQIKTDDESPKRGNSKVKSQIKKIHHKHIKSAHKLTNSKTKEDNFNSFAQEGNNNTMDFVSKLTKKYKDHLRVNSFSNINSKKENGTDSQGTISIRLNNDGNDSLLISRSKSKDRSLITELAGVKEMNVLTGVKKLKYFTPKTNYPFPNTNTNETTDSTRWKNLKKPPHSLESLHALQSFSTSNKLNSLRMPSSKDFPLKLKSHCTLNHKHPVNNTINMLQSNDPHTATHRLNLQQSPNLNTLAPIIYNNPLHIKKTSIHQRGRPSTQRPLVNISSTASNNKHKQTDRRNHLPHHQVIYSKLTNSMLNQSNHLNQSHQNNQANQSNENEILLSSFIQKQNLSKPDVFDLSANEAYTPEFNLNSSPQTKQNLNFNHIPFKKYIRGTTSHDPKRSAKVLTLRKLQNGKLFYPFPSSNSIATEKEQNWYEFENNNNSSNSNSLFDLKSNYTQFSQNPKLNTTKKLSTNYSFQDSNVKNCNFDEINEISDFNAECYEWLSKSTLNKQSNYLLDLDYENQYSLPFDRNRQNIHSADHKVRPNKIQRKNINIVMNNLDFKKQSGMLPFLFRQNLENGKISPETKTNEQGIPFISEKKQLIQNYHANIPEKPVNSDLQYSKKKIEGLENLNELESSQLKHSEFKENIKTTQQRYLADLNRKNASNKTKKDIKSEKQRKKVKPLKKEWEKKRIESGSIRIKTENQNSPYKHSSEEVSCPIEHKRFHSFSNNIPDTHTETHTDTRITHTMPMHPIPDVNSYREQYPVIIQHDSNTQTDRHNQNQNQKEKEKDNEYEEAKTSLCADQATPYSPNHTNTSSIPHSSSPPSPHINKHSFLHTPLPLNSKRASTKYSINFKNSKHASLDDKDLAAVFSNDEPYLFTFNKDSLNQQYTAENQLSSHSSGIIPTQSGNLTHKTNSNDINTAMNKRKQSEVSPSEGKRKVVGSYNKPKFVTPNANKGAVSGVNKTYDDRNQFSCPHHPPPFKIKQIRIKSANQNSHFNISRSKLFYSLISIIFSVI